LHNIRIFRKYAYYVWHAAYVPPAARYTATYMNVVQHFNASLKLIYLLAIW